MMNNASDNEVGGRMGWMQTGNCKNKECAPCIQYCSSEVPIRSNGAMDPEE